MSVAQEMKSILEDAFAPEILEIRNDSSKHAGHAGDDGSGESHFHITIKSPAFANMNRLAKHRAVHSALGQDILTRVHAMGLDIQG
jgi:BolA family transcriptional regulator, general stress-responsive regulator